MTAVQSPGDTRDVGSTASGGGAVETHPVRRRRRRRLTGATPGGGVRVPWLFLLPAALIFLVFKFIPMAEGIRLSLYEVRPFLGDIFVGFENYATILRDEKFLTAGAMVAGFFLALLLEGHAKSLWFVRSAVFLPVVAARVLPGARRLPQRTHLVGRPRALGVHPQHGHLAGVGDIRRHLEACAVRHGADPRRARRHRPTAVRGRRHRRGHDAATDLERHAARAAARHHHPADARRHPRPARLRRGLRPHRRRTGRIDRRVDDARLHHGVRTVRSRARLRWFRAVVPGYLGFDGQRAVVPPRREAR
ncbi:hypothetical protein SAMN05421507_11746 [Lentzea jiangxiensis]|uniref:Multiple sugar transport system permease protein n=1 Tax=Lentzea jiangxiensis TaxID=641025 RepID=A0A1H0W567_9PSEU|nr:hypothetical protein SAMN05421507_11746 [Lentzea jiangxiensis]